MEAPVFIIAGHNKNAPGAIGFDGITEHERTTDLQRRVALHSYNVLRNFGTSMEVLTDAEEKSNAQVRTWIKQHQQKGSRGIDIHFNNNNPKASGTEIIIHPNTSNENKRRAIWLVNNVAGALGLNVRQREKGRDYIYPHETFVGSLPIIEKTDIPFILLEVCFLNEYDLKRYNGREEIIAHIIRWGMLLLDFSEPGSETQTITLPLYQS